MNAPIQPAVETLPATVYADASLWPHERSRIFAKSWQYVGHESALTEPGAWVADTVAGYPMLAVRGQDGVLRSFHNVCRHRAGPLTQGSSGKCEGLLTCQYHGWTYTLDGRLRAARDFGPSPGFDPRDFGLHPVRVETWRGLVFAAVSEDAPSLAEWLAPVEARLKGADWSRLKIAATRQHHLACNWKTYVENYLEGYHIPLIHPGLEADVDSSRYSVEVDGHVAIHLAPPRKPDAVYDGLWAWAWPNSAFNVYGRGLMFERMSPLGHDRTRLDYIYLTPEGEAVSDETMAMSDAVLAEDLWVVERVQENLNAGVYRTGRLSSRHEVGVAAFQAFYREAMDGLLG
ncbi:aromatic ring-hydroxylating oxygenase subunit alpha [Phenylobacterium montanum]|uniref:Rieske 2Fe-2S domain-containing protein n=1 Tax=Phenylobacterium montanum TaxID=2823693 RepID=A0A975FXF4_9CAUL|nr:SRPBCC family protein [Caulobacter sp. S6]QUD86931.1 Rieske 2Fe-2S domain-containing protein [Caulobacter sp. S6]